MEVANKQTKADAQTTTIGGETPATTANASHTWSAAATTMQQAFGVTYAVEVKERETEKQAECHITLGHFAVACQFCCKKNKNELVKYALKCYWIHAQRQVSPKDSQRDMEEEEVQACMEVLDLRYNRCN
ncbi:unnamed protein product [Ceratitis capitata]|uniref:(Mediterranean fruit fly) hypothetical protein n=1 Tax=Ceratitis capitata TaxID=7213 RepID=A0A811V264_CERCA|nr:unnamed protein product [Ceratitis capitata]